MYKNILLPIDLTDEGGQAEAVEAAAAIAKSFGAKINVVTVVPDFGMTIVGEYFPKDFEQKALKNAQAKLHDFVKAHLPEPDQVQHIVGHGSAYREILRVAEDIKADLIVMASHRPEMQDHLLGPNAGRVVRHADCSVLVVRGG